MSTTTGLVWALSATPVALATAGAFLYYACTDRKTRLKHSIAASYLWGNVRDAALPSGCDAHEHVKRVSVHGLLLDLGKHYFHVENAEIKDAFIDLCDDGREPLTDYPIQKLLRILRVNYGVEGIPEEDCIATCEVTVHYSFNLDDDIYVATWEYWAVPGATDPNILHFPPYGWDDRGSEVPGSPRVVDAYVTKRNRPGCAKTSVMNILRPWLGPRGNFHCDMVPESRRPSTIGLNLLLRGEHRNARFLHIVDNHARTFQYDLHEHTCITAPALWP